MSTRFFEETWKHRFFFTRRRFVCEMSVKDNAAFGLIFSTATSKLKEWRDANPRNAVEFELRLTATAMVLQRAQGAFQELYHSDSDAYAFVKKLKTAIRFTDMATGRTEHLDLSPS